MNKSIRLFYIGLLAGMISLFSCQEDETLPTATVSLSSDTFTLSEAADTPLSIALNLSTAWSSDLTFDISTSGTAIAGVDFEAISSELTIVAGETSATLDITPIDNYELETSERTLTLSIDQPAEDGLTLSLGEATITFIDNEVAGSVIAAFETTSFTTNEYLEDSITVPLVINAAFAEDLTFSYTYGGSAVSGTNYTASETSTVTISAGSTSAEIIVPILDSKSYDATSDVTLTLQTPENGAIALGNEITATIDIINPMVDMTLWHDEDYLYNSIYAYNTFEDVAVPESGTKNSDEEAGVVFDYSFAFTNYIYNSDETSDPNALGFKNRSLWSEEEYWKSTNVFNMQDFYAGNGPNTIDMNVSNASAGLFIDNAIRFVPETDGATSGIAIVPDQKVTVYQKDETDDDIVNYPSFEVEISGEGTYDETTHKINLTITFDETSINNGIQIRRFELVPSAYKR